MFFSALLSMPIPGPWMDVSHLPCTKWYKASERRGCEKVWRNRASLLHADTQPAPCGCERRGQRRGLSACSNALYVCSLCLVPVRRYLHAFRMPKALIIPHLIMRNLTAAQIRKRSRKESRHFLVICRGRSSSLFGGDVILARRMMGDDAPEPVTGLDQSGLVRWLRHA